MLVDGRSGIRMVVAMTVLAFSPASGWTQSTFQPNWASFGSANLGMNTLAHQQDTLHGRAVEARRADALRRATTPTTYVSDPAVTRRVAEAFADHVDRIAGPEKGRVVCEELSRRNFVAAWRTMTAADGYRSGDVADAFAAYWALNWAMANGADPSPGQSAGARRQVQSFLVKLAIAMGKAIDNKMDQMLAKSRQLYQANQSGAKSQTATLSGENSGSQPRDWMLSNALSNLIKSVGEAFSTPMRKN